MMIKQAGLFLKNSSRLMAGLSSVFAIMTFMIVASTSSVNAQVFLNEVDAAEILKVEINQLSNNNCVKAAPQGTSQEIATQMNHLRCDFYQSVYRGLLVARMNESSIVQNRITTAVSAMKEKFPQNTEAIDLLESEIIDILKA